MVSCVFIKSLIDLVGQIRVLGVPRYSTQFSMLYRLFPNTYLNSKVNVPNSARVVFSSLVKGIRVARLIWVYFITYRRKKIKIHEEALPS